MTVREEPAASPLPRQRGLAWLEVAALVVFAAWFLRGREHAVDLHLWDELVAYWSGHDLVRLDGGPDLAWAPLHALTYGLWSLSPVLPPAQDAMALTVVVFVLLAAFWFLRALAPPWLAAGFAILVVSTSGISQPDRVGQPGLPTVYAFVLGLGFLAAGLQARGRTGAAALVLGLAAIDRGELVPWFAAYAALSAVLPPLRRRPRLRLALVLAAAAAAAVVVLSPPHRERSWLAFRQHYARQACLREFAAEWERLQGKVDPERLRLAPFELQRAFDAPDSWIERDMPGATSLASAILVAPQHVFAHVEHNLLQLPAVALSATRSCFVGDEAWRYGQQGVALLALVGLLLRRRREESLSRTDERRLWPWLAGTSVLAMLGPLLVWARPELCLPLLVLGSGLCCRGLAGLLPRSWNQGGARDSWIVAAVAAAFALLPSPFAEAHPPLRHRATVSVLQQDLPQGPVVLLSWWWEMPWRLLARSDVERKSLWGVPTRPFAELLDEWQVDAVLVTPELEFELQRFPDARTVLSRAPWRLVREVGEVRLYRR